LREKENACARAREREKESSSPEKIEFVAFRTRLRISALSVEYTIVEQLPHKYS